MDNFANKYKDAVLAFNFDDFILLPGFAKMEPKDVKLGTRFSKNIKMNIPIVSSPMDTVTEATMAIALARNGGMGVIHRNCSTEEEVEMVKAVKNEQYSKETYKNAVVDDQGRLRVVAGISPFDMERAKQLSKYADALLVDVAHFHNSNVIEAAKKISTETGSELVIGSFGTKDGVLDCVRKIENAGALRVGIGGGSICTTTDVTRAGSPALFAVAQAADALEEMGRSDIPIIADGGIRNAGDISLTAVFGASSAMLGYALAGCKESPSEIKMINDKQYKLHRGMGSHAARAKRAALDRYGNAGKNLAEGVEMMIPYTGEVDDVVGDMLAGIRASIGYAGAEDMESMKKIAKVARVNYRNKSSNKAEDRKAILI